MGGLETDLKVGDYKSNPTLAWRTKVGGTDGPFRREAHDEYALTLVTSMLRWVRSLLGRAVSDLVRGVPARLRLRTKLLFSFVLMTTCLTSITLLVLRREAQGQVQHQIEQDARNAILTFQTVQRQQQSALARKADLLASLAFMRQVTRRRLRTRAKIRGNRTTAICLCWPGRTAASWHCTRRIRRCPQRLKL